MNTVIFESGRNGSVICRYEGKISFPEKNGPQPKVGEEWEVLFHSSNPSGNVHFLKLGKKIEKENPGSIRVQANVYWYAGDPNKICVDFGREANEKMKKSLKGRVGSIHSGYRFKTSSPIDQGIWEVDVILERIKISKSFDYEVSNVSLISMVKSRREHDEEQERKNQEYLRERKRKAIVEREERCREMFGGMSIAELESMIKKYSLPITHTDEWEQCIHKVHVKCQSSSTKDLSIIESRIKSVVEGESNRYLSLPLVLNDPGESWYHDVRWHCEEGPYVLARSQATSQDVQKYYSSIGYSNVTPRRGLRYEDIDDGDNTQYGHYLD